METRNKVLAFLLSVVIISSSIFCNAQQKRATASFTDESHDFAKINESDGRLHFSSRLQILAGNH